MIPHKRCLKIQVKQRCVIHFTHTLRYNRAMADSSRNAEHTGNRGRCGFERKT